LQESARGFIVARCNVGEFKVDERRGIQMLLALEINLALWGMIICAVMGTVQFVEVF
jgi:hypothetical protein